VAAEEDETLADAFWGVARTLRHLASQTLEPWEISPSQSRALGVLVRHGLMRLSELSEHLHIAPRSTTEVVDALEQRGLVERRPDPDDRRATLVAVTAEGARTNAAIKGARKAEAERLFGSLGDSDRAHLARILRKLRD
jgi:DNA-binding MarR family transcriptional regulator